MARIFLLLLLAFPLKNLACLCSYQGNFLQLVTKTDLIVLGTVKEFSNYNSPETMEFEIEEVIKGRTTLQKIIVYGQSGVNCLEWLNKFEIGKTYILSLYKNNNINSFETESSNYNLSGCGTYWLYMIDNNAHGTISKERPVTFNNTITELNERISIAKENGNRRKLRKLEKEKRKLYDSLKETLTYEKLKQLIHLAIEKNNLNKNKQ